MRRLSQDDDIELQTTSLTPLEEMVDDDNDDDNNCDDRSNDGGIQIDVNHLYYKVQTGNSSSSTINILDDISFRLDAKCLCALVGPSGSGKSTLLDLLANRKLTGQWSGEILFNGLPRSIAIDRNSAYVLQDDLHYATLTVRESLYFAVAFKLPSDATIAEINQRLNSLLQMVNLDHIQNSLIGDANRKGISGGELKRLSIAVEIAALPKLIYVDEPTSGLDSSMAFDVMKVIKDLTLENRTCLVTIHQPSMKIFELFDKIALLSEGKLLYCGPSSSVIDYFTSAPLLYKFESGENPVEFMISIAEGQLFPEETLLPYPIEDLAKTYQLSKYYSVSSNSEIIPLSKEFSLRFESAEESTSIVLIGYSLWRKFLLLSERNFLAIKKDYLLISAQLGKNIIVGLLIGTIFVRQGETKSPLFDPRGLPTAQIQSVSSLLFFGIMFIMLSNIQAIPYLCSRNLIFRREIASNCYSAGPYFFSHCLTVIPLQFLGFTLFTLITYFMVGFHNDFYFFYYFFTLLMMANMCSYYFAMFLAASTQSTRVSFVLFPLSFLFLSIFAGYAISIDDIPPFWSWATYVNYTRWIFQGLMTVQWSYYDEDESRQVLALYGMHDFNPNTAYWITGLALGVFLLLIYWAMRPPKANLVWVQKDDFIDSSSSSNFKNVSMYHASSFQISESTKPLEPCQLIFKDICYSINMKKGNNNHMKNILIDVNGKVEPGEMCAVIGSSGSGKSTLLDILANRKTTGIITGDVFLNQLRRSSLSSSTSSSSSSSSSWFNEKVGYVPQENIFIDALTVRETLYFAAELKLPQNLSTAEKTERIQDILHLLGLNQIADSIVGNEEKRGISGGQKKRLSIGVEIIHLPELIFLDEPTTGLDSMIAYEVISMIRRITDQGRTIICTIHQPSKHIFELFHQVIFLSQGKVIYYGKGIEMGNYFTSLPNYSFPWNIDHMNPCDYALAIASQQISTTNGNTISIEKLAEIYQESIIFKELYCTITSLSAESIQEEAIPRNPIQLQQQHQRPSLFYQVKTLVHRSLLRRRRELIPNLIVSFRSIVFGIFLGTIFFQLHGGKNIHGYYHRISIFFFFLLTLLMWQSKAIPDLVEDRHLLQREIASQACSNGGYWISRLIVQLMFDLFNIFLYAIILYHCIGLRQTNSGFGYFLLIAWISSLISFFICEFLAFISFSTEMAVIFFPVVLFFATSFEGFIVYLSRFPNWLRWGTNLAYLRFAFQGLIVNEFADNAKDLPLGQDFLETLSFDTLSKKECIGYLILFLGFHGILSFLALEFVQHEKR